MLGVRSKSYITSKNLWGTKNISSSSESDTVTLEVGREREIIIILQGD